MTKLLNYLAAIAVSAFMLLLFNQSAPKADADRELEENTIDKLPQIIKPVKIDGSVNFAGEYLPEDNFDVLERLDRELLVNSYWHSSTMLNIKAARRYFPVIENILAEEGVPDDFKYIAVAESNLRNATSPAGAKGLWQFMPAVAKGFGLEISSYVDERYHVEKATRAACKLIKSYKKRFGNWTNAAGAYNMGETRFAKELDRQKMESYYDMNFGEETGRYVFRILAIKEIMRNPDKYGFYLDKNELFQPFDNLKKVEVSSGISNLGEFAKEHGTTYRMLKVFNPWLTSYTLPGNGKTYSIDVPAS